MNIQLKQLVQQSPFYNALIDVHAQATVRNAACGDILTLKASIHQKTIVALSFSGQGCRLSQVALNMLAYKILNRYIDKLADITPEQLCNDLELDIGPNRKQCIALACQCLTELIENYRVDGAQ